jgi:hypothetical protein
MPDMGEAEGETGETGESAGGREVEAGGTMRGGREGAGVVTLELNTIRATGADDESLLHPEIGAKKDKELFEMAEKLYALRNDPAYPHKNNFVL